jgi:hypothetical protein
MKAEGGAGPIVNLGSALPQAEAFLTRFVRKISPFSQIV